MPFTRIKLDPKANYSRAEQERAAQVFAKWQAEEPRCQKTAAEVLRLERDGPMIRYEGSGVDAGQWMQVSFLYKPAGGLKLAAAVAELPDRSTFARLLARAMRDALQLEGAEHIYFHVTDRDDLAGSPWVKLLPTLFANLDVIFPGVFLTLASKLPGEQRGMRWEVRLA